VKLSVAPQISHNFGYTEYIMDISILTDSGLFELKSELEFPLDVVMAGVTVGLYSNAEALYAWSIEGGYFINLDDPGGVMKDHDWMTLVWGQEAEKFSYTESRVEMKSTLVTAEASLRVAHGRSFDLDLWGGFRYQKIEQDVIGYDGWQLDTNLVRHELSGTEPAIFYRVVYKSPHFGLRSNIRLGRHTSIGAKAAFALVWTSDYDDHLLRFKDAAADITGRGFISGLSLRHRLPYISGRAQPFFELVGGFIYFHASGSQTQYWYGDDPVTEDNDTGTIISGVSIGMEMIPSQRTMILEPSSRASPMK